MANKKTAKNKSRLVKTTSKKEEHQVDDPIIIKGGSISVSFDKKFNPGKFKFDHPNSGKQLTQLVVLRLNGATGEYEVVPGPFAYARIPLQSQDQIVICYTGSLCF
jgi:hypothetical protein